MGKPRRLVLVKQDSGSVTARWTPDVVGRVVNLDRPDRLPVELPAVIGFEQLAVQTYLEEGRHVRFVARPQVSRGYPRLAWMLLAFLAMAGALHACQRDPAPAPAVERAR